MLPDRLLSFDRAESEVIRPRWLTSRDDTWLQELCLELAALDGLAIGTAEERLIEVVAPRARANGVGRRIVEAVWLVERRRFKTSIDAPVSPVKLRRTLFDLAAERSREEAIATTAAELGVPLADVRRCLFADRQKLRKLVAPSAKATPTDLRERYNLTLAQSLLVRSTEVVAVVRGHTRRVVGYAKLLGLMVSFEDAPNAALRLTISGPLSLFHDTLKYGRALAMWMPALVATPEWQLECRLVIEGEKRRLQLDASAPLARTHALPRAFDSKLEARLERDLRRLRLPWRIERESSVVRAGERLFFPDFTLVGEDERRVAIEIAGFWTQEYLASKVTVLEAASAPFVLCIDERREGAFEKLAPELRAKLCPFHAFVDATALVTACEQALDRKTMSLPSVDRPTRAHWLTVPSTPWLARHASALGADRERWREEIVLDLVCDARAHLAIGERSRLFLVGKRFAVEVVRDKTRDDALFVHRVLAPSTVRSLKSEPLSARLELRSPGAPSPARDDIVESIGWARREAERSRVAC